MTLSARDRADVDCAVCRQLHGLSVISTRPTGLIHPHFQHEKPAVYDAAVLTTVLPFTSIARGPPTSHLP